MFCLFVRANLHQSDRPGLPDPHFLLEKPKKPSGYHEVQSHTWPPGIGEGSQYTPCEGQHFFLVPGSGNKGRSCVDGSRGPGTLHPYHPHLKGLSREEPDVTAKRHKNCWGGGTTPFPPGNYPVPKYSQASIKICQYPNPSAAPTHKSWKFLREEAGVKTSRRPMTWRRCHQ